jgi:GH25 family lysozyme M1 (1,4-beta-N-acetylmuramidase)
VTTETRPALMYEGFCDGIDVSSVQVITNAQAVADDGFVFAAVKVSEGVNYCDPKALEHLARLRDVGLICNVYTFLRPSQGNPRAQVERAMACAGDVFPSRLLLDGEGAPDGMPAGEIVAFYEECADVALEFGALESEFYSYPDYILRRLQPALARSKRLGRCPFHIAAYGPGGAWLPPRGFKPFLCAPWNTWTKHQYSGNGGYRVRGILGDCDRNLFNGDVAALRRYMGFPDDRPTEPEQIIHPRVEWPER